MLIFLSASKLGELSSHQYAAHPSLSLITGIINYAGCCCQLDWGCRVPWE